MTANATTVGREISEDATTVGRAISEDATTVETEEEECRSSDLRALCMQCMQFYVLSVSTFMQCLNKQWFVQFILS